MDLLLIVALIVWITNSAKKRREAQKQQEAARARARAAAYAEAIAEAEAAAQADAAPQPTVRPTVLPQQDKRQAEPRVTAPEQRRHPLTPSRETGHAHMETSMTGFTEVCPPASASAPFEKAPLSDRLAAYKAEKRRAERAAAPEKTNAPQVIDLAAASGDAFRFDPARVRDGLIYAEILGKPKALRR